jgi:hypothetical protein
MSQDQPDTAAVHIAREFDKIDLNTRQDRRGNNHQRPKVERRDTDIVGDGFVIRVSEFFYPVPKFSYGLGRIGKDQKFVPFIHHESIDKVVAKLNELKQLNQKTIDAAEIREEQRRLQNLSKQEKNQLQQDRKLLRGTMRGAVKTPNFEAARRRSEKQKQANRQTWEAPQTLVKDVAGG